MDQDQLLESTEPKDIIIVEELSVGYGKKTVLENVSFCVKEGEILTVLGSSGCGKTTLLKAMVGLIPASRGRIYVVGEEICEECSLEALSRVHRKIGVLFQSGALLDSLSVSQNVALPLRTFTDLPRDMIEAMVHLKLDLVKLGNYGHLMPYELSGGMSKRAGLARAMALDPTILFCDEPTSGLDPPTAVEIDDLLLELKTHLDVTLVVVTHDLDSIEKISTRSILLDSGARGIIATGSPQKLREESEDGRVRAFFRRKLAARFSEWGSR